MIAEPRWEELENKEKKFCSENSIKPEDYLYLKKKIIEE